MAHTLPALPYDLDALEPHISRQTLEFHHGKHHNAYVTNLNNAVTGDAALDGKTLEELLENNLAIVPDAKKAAVRNNGGGHLNHSLFWQTLSPAGAGGLRWRARGVPHRGCCSKTKARGARQGRDH